MSSRVRICSILLLSVLVCISSVHAAPQNVDELWDVSVNGKTVTCGGLINGKYYSGTTSADSLFSMALDKVKALRKKYKATSGSTRTKLKKKLDALNKKVKANDLACSGGPNSTPPSSPPPTTQPTPTRTPSPTATSTPRPTGNFDSSGNVTATGKTAFGIPSSLNANITSGSVIWNSDCKGCHSSEKLGRTFSSYKVLIQGSPMFIFGTPDQELAHLTAYLNRFDVN